MSKTVKIIFILLILLGLAFTAVACSSVIDDYANVESIEVDQESIADGFLLSEFDISKVKLNVTYKAVSDDAGGEVPGEMKQISATMNMVKAEDKPYLSIAGTRTITLLYGKFTVSFTLTLRDDVLSKFKVIFMDEDNNMLGDAQYVAANGRAVPPTAPAKAEFDFIGWLDRDTGRIASYDNITKNTTFQASYAQKSFTVTYYSRAGATVTQIGTATVARGGNALTVAPTIPVVSGYSNGRWEDEDAMQSVTAAGLSFYAIYDKDKVLLTLTYKKFSDVDQTFSQAYEVGTEISLSDMPDVPREKFHFIGWYTMDGVAVTFPYTVLSEMSFVAKYVAEETGSNGLIYAVRGDGRYEVTGYNGTDSIIVIPEKAVGVNGEQEVRSAKAGAFSDVTVSAFYVSNSNLYFATHDGVLYNFDKTVLYAYPKGRSASSYTVENTVLSIESYAFYGASRLTSLYLNSGLTTIGKYALAECTALRSLTVPASVAEIEDNAFRIEQMQGGLTALTFTNPSALSRVGQYAFYGLSEMTRIDFPASLENLGNGAFYGCKSLAVVTAENNARFTVDDGGLYNTAKTVLYVFPALYSDSASPDITLPATLNEIRTGAFYFARITGVYIRSNLTLMDDSIVCPNLSIVRINSANIGYTTGVFGVYLPERIYANQANAAYASLQNDFAGIVHPYVESEWNNSVQDYLNNFIYSISGSEVTILGYRGKETELVIPNILAGISVTAIAPRAFYGNDTVTSIVLPVTLTSIGEEAFRLARKLTSVTFQADLKSIADRAFYDCIGLNELIYPEELALESFGKEVFAGTPWLEDSNTEFLTINGLLIRYNGYSISVTVPFSVYYIATDAFSNKTNLTEVLFATDLDRQPRIRIIDYRAFQFCTGLLTLNLPYSVTEVRAEAFYGCTSLYWVNVAEAAADSPIADNTVFPQKTVVTYADDLENNSYDLIYHIEDETRRVTGIVIISPAEVSNTSSMRFSGWYTDLTYTTMVEFPITLTESRDVYAKMVPILSGTAGLRYQLNADNEYTVVDYVGTDSYVIVPVRYKGISVTQIASDAFSNAPHLRYIQLPNTTREGLIVSYITSVGYGAFDGTAWLNSFTGDFVVIDRILVKYKGSAQIVEIPSDVTRIAQGAFEGNTDIVRVKIPTGVTELPDGVFRGCTNLNEVILPSGLYYIDSQAFAGCTKLRNINFSECTGLFSISYDALDGTAYLNEYINDCVIINDILYRYKGKSPILHLMNGIRRIEAYAFEGNPYISDIYIPQSVQSIGESAFANTTVNAVYFYTGGNYLMDIADYAFMNCGNLSILNLSVCGNLVNIGKYAFANALSYRNTVLPASLLTLGEGAFYGAGLTQVNFASGSKLKAISDYAFATNLSLTKVIFNGTNALESIGAYAFFNCGSMTHFTNRGAAIRSIGAHAFENCVQLVNLNIDETQLVDIGDSALSNVGYVLQEVSKMVLLGGILLEYNGTDKVINIPDHITIINNDAFKNNTNITTIVFGAESQLKGINSGAFYGCSNLSDIVFPAGVTYVGDDVMTGTKWMENHLRAGTEYITIANTLIKYNGETARVIIPEGITVINAGAFDGAGVYDILIGAWVERIAAGAFDGITAEYSDWTITMLAETPPTLEETALIGAYAIYVDNEDVLETYLLDWVWVNQFDKLSALVRYEVQFEVGSFATLLDKIYINAIYEQIPLITEDGYRFIGWFTDAEFRQAVKYPMILTEDTVLYAKVVDMNIGADPTQYEHKDDEIILYLDEYATQIVVISELSGTVFTKIGQGYLHVGLGNGTHALDNGNYVPSAGGAYIYVGAFEGHNEIQEVYFATNSQINTIGTNAFKDCVDLRKIVIPASVTLIKAGAFAGCISLREVIFEEGGTSLTIEAGAFAGCISLRELTLPKHLTELGNGAFSGCTALLDIYLNNEEAIMLSGNQPFELVVGMIIHIYTGSLNSYNSYWPSVYRNYFREVTA